MGSLPLANHAVAPRIHCRGSLHHILCLCIAASLSAAVHDILLPIMKEIKKDLNSVKDDLSSVKKDLSSLNKSVSRDLEDYKHQTAFELAGLASQLAGLQSNMTSELAGLTSQLAGLQSNMTSELAGLQSSVTSAVISTCTDFLPLDCCQV